ncbi:uncharacterized protein PHALS_14867 [Plasmopara halstedii]|uniref:Uncharacterized protein n=1 Tax=Plasmopara halstedii TaxID=4781 RepID=A0A0N7L3N5_PLAHL|nr:uncharacterized protein PHALS_14867 [Plasmopara halstedii]CEG36371.1 hypothetical protein PHALS_14867 [Plasmopara halstedii]|eukprot:XP_024572740.1 hypothetical protein PHALS_14867 [Plasmopara halstedii]
MRTILVTRSFSAVNEVLSQVGCKIWLDPPTAYNALTPIEVVLILRKDRCKVFVMNLMRSWMLCHLSSKLVRIPLVMIPSKPKGYDASLLLHPHATLLSHLRLILKSLQQLPSQYGS